MKHYSRAPIVAAAFWSLSFTLTLVGTVDYHSARDWQHLFLWWGAWVGLLAHVPTSIAVVGYFADRNRDTNHEVVELVMGGAQHDGGDVRQFRR